jgi:pimeloyl-ACP methyl ester carboxylesterase
MARLTALICRRSVRASVRGGQAQIGTRGRAPIRGEPGYQMERGSASGAIVGRIASAVTVGRGCEKLSFGERAGGTLYAKTSAGRVAYQVVGTGPPAVLAMLGSFVPVDLMWDEPRLVRFLTGLSSFSRHISLDPRGRGVSDSIAPLEGRLTENVVDDMIAVLDSLGCGRVVVLGAIGTPELQFAATHPERTSALVLINPTARIRRAEDYPAGHADEGIATFLATVRDRWGTGVTLGALAPSLARFARW